MPSGYVAPSPNPSGFGLGSVAVAIPALNPPAGSSKSVRAITATGVGQIIVIKDGSLHEFDDSFNQPATLPHTTVSRHEVNRGKGAGLRSGITQALTDRNLIGVVTTDADRQHAVADVATIGRTLVTYHQRGHEAIIFGARDFTRDGIPPKSRIGNRIASRLLAILFSRYIGDTQTGLRGFPRNLAQRVLKIGGDRFEYEMNVLLWALTDRVPLEEVPIATIYHDATNSVSNFRPVQDASRIYAMIFKKFTTTNSVRRNGAAAGLALVAVLRVLRRRSPNRPR